jgi:adenylate cyclase class IV
MARNIEIKARLDEGIAAVLPRALALPGAQGPTLIEQDDSFYAVAHGRLKLRRFADGTAELIHYERGDTESAKASDYVRCPLLDASAADALHQALERAQGLLGRVIKQRQLVLVGSTRIHLDRVQGLADDHLELEVVLAPGQDDAEGQRIADALMQALGLAAAPRISGAYLDLLRGPHPASRAHPLDRGAGQS